MCTEEVCDARIGMCVHVRAPLMHGRSRCRVSCVAPAAGILAVVESQVATVRATGPSCQRSSCDKRAFKKAHKSHSSCSQRGFTIQVKLWCSCTWDILLLLPPPSLSLSLALGGMCGRREGWMDGWMDEWREGGGSSLLFVSPSIWRVC